MQRRLPMHVVKALSHFENAVQTHAFLDGEHRRFQPTADDGGSPELDLLFGDDFPHNLSLAHNRSCCHSCRDHGFFTDQEHPASSVVIGGRLPLCAVSVCPEEIFSVGREKCNKYAVSGQ